MRFETKDGRVFEALEREPYTRTDGSATWLRCWRGSCRECGAPFVVRTPDARPTESKAFGRVHCDEHKAARRAVLPLPGNRAEGGWHEG